MPATKKHTNNVGSGGVIVDDKVRNYADDPFFAKKIEEAKIAVKKLNFQGIEKK